MSEPAPAHAWLQPRLTALLAEAEKAGIARDVAVAVLMDLLSAPPFDTAAPSPVPYTDLDPGQPPPAGQGESFGTTPIDLTFDVPHSGDGRI